MNILWRVMEGLILFMLSTSMSLQLDLVKASSRDSIMIKLVLLATSLLEADD